MRPPNLALTASAVLVALGACSPDASRDTSADAADISAINAVNARVLEALNSGDWQRLNELTDPEYVAIINGRPIAGTAALEASNQSFLEQWDDEEAWLPDETIIDGDLAFQRGSFTMTLAPRNGDGEARDLEGTYLHIYQRRPDGTWALTRAMAASSN